MNRENTERYSAVTETTEQTLTKLKEENVRLGAALYDSQKLQEQLRGGLFNLLEPALDNWLRDGANDFLETHFDIADYTDDIADAMPKPELDIDDYESEIRDVVRDIVKYADVKIEV